MANLVTGLRLVLLFLFVVWIYQAPIEWQLANPFLLGLIFLLDAVDGFIARFQGETSVFGAAFDVAADRVIENVLWLVLVDLNWVPVWVAMVFLVRGFLVDALRNYQSGAPFDMMRSRFGRFLVKGRFLRFSYALVKFLAFAWWFMLIPLANTDSILWNTHQVELLAMANGLLYLAVALCLVRGVPVLLESLTAQLKTQ